MKLLYGLIDESFKCKYGIGGIAENSIAFKSRSISLVSAKNSFAAFQLCLKSDEPVTVSTGKSPVFSPRGLYTNIRLECGLEQLPNIKIDVFPVLYMEDDDGVYKADILSNDEAVEVKPGLTQPVWLEICVGSEIKAGIYNGKVGIYVHKMFEDEEKLDTLDFTLEVKDMAMPDPCDYKYFLDLWQHPSNISRKHEVHLWSEEHFEVLEKYIKTLAELGAKVITIMVSEIPWSGQFCCKAVNYPSDMFEYSMIRVEKNEQGEFVYDYSAMKRYVNLCYKYGIDKEIEVFGLFNIWVNEEEGYGSVAPDYPDAIRIRYFDKKDGCFKYVKTVDDIKAYIKALEEYFIKEGLVDKVRICADEPANMEKFMKSMELLKKTAPRFKYKVAINHIEFMETIKEVEDCVVSFYVLKQSDDLEKIKRNTAGRVLYYVCCGPRIPNTFLRSDLVEAQLLGILAGIMKFDGFLRWNYTAWPEKPREKIRYKFPGWPAGDTNFVYPGNDGRPLLTLRYKNLKRGIEFFELIQMVREHCSDADDVIGQVRSRVLRTDDLMDFIPDRKKLAEEIFSLEYKDYQEAFAILLDAGKSIS